MDMTKFETHLIGIGRLGKDATLTATRNGKPYAYADVCMPLPVIKTNDDTPYWVSATAFDGLAQKLASFREGEPVQLSGRLQIFRNDDGDRLQLLPDSAESPVGRSRPVWQSPPGEEAREWRT